MAIQDHTVMITAGDVTHVSTSCGFAGLGGSVPLVPNSQRQAP